MISQLYYITYYKRQDILIEDCDNAKCVPLYDHPYSDLYIFFGYLYSGLDELGMDKTLPIYETLRNLSLFHDAEED